MGLPAIRFKSGWLEEVKPGKPFRMQKGAELKDQTSRKKIREHGELMTVDEVASRLKVRDETIYDWIHTGDSRGRKLGHFKVGKHYRISEIHLEEFLA